jgi:hypothetical protein
MERKFDSNRLRSIMQQKSEEDVLKERIVELQSWIKDFSVKANFCSYEILRTPCENCQCFRKPTIGNDK